MYYIINPKQYDAIIVNLEDKKLLSKLIIEYSEQNLFELFPESLYFQINHIYQVQFDSVEMYELFNSEMEESFYNVFFKDKESTSK